MIPRGPLFRTVGRRTKQLTRAIVFKLMAANEAKPPANYVV